MISGNDNIITLTSKCLHYTSLRGAPSILAKICRQTIRRERDRRAIGVEKAGSVGLEAGKLLKKICLPEEIQIQNCC